MAEDDNPVSGAVGGLKGTLKKRYGPLPGWGWALVIGGGLTAVFLLRRPKAGSASQSAVAARVPGASLAGGGGSGGTGGGYSAPGTQSPVGGGGGGIIPNPADAARGLAANTLVVLPSTGIRPPTATVVLPESVQATQLVRDSGGQYVPAGSLIGQLAPALNFAPSLTQGIDDSGLNRVTVHTAEGDQEELVTNPVADVINRAEEYNQAAQAGQPVDFTAAIQELQAMQGYGTNR